MQKIEETKEQIKISPEAEKNLAMALEKAELLPDEKNYIITKNLILRPSRITDAESMALILTNPEAMKYYGNGQVRTKEEVETFATYRANANNNPAKGVYTWVVFSKEGPIGYQAVRFPDGQQELIVATIPEYQGKGYTKEAASSLMAFIGGGFIATAHPDHQVGIKFLESLEFIKDVTKQNLEKHDSIRDYYYCDKYKDCQSQLIR